MSVQGLNLLVFRDGKKRASGRSLKTALSSQIQLLRGASQPDARLEALLLAGELESALAEDDSESLKFCEITDALADALINSPAAPNREELLAILDATHIPEELRISVPEGFAYYALHPLAFDDVLDRVPASFSSAVVVGIRTIGTTLSAVTTAALRKRGIQARRITVRPKGHPYNRSTQLLPGHMELVRKGMAARSSFLVVDEGPGLSGSSFLSVAEALVQAGVSKEAIALICSHEPDFDSLCADNAAQRARQFHWVSASQDARRPVKAQVWIGGGEWRRFLMPREATWPASWVNFERLKYLSGETAEPRFYKFLGLGRFGREAFEWEARLAAAGFAVPPRMESDGFGSYGFVEGRPMSAADISESVLARLAAYCACRLHALPAESADLNALQQMAVHNLEQLRLDVPLSLQLEHPVFADGRMQPHEWLLTRDGQMLKADSGSHGDDHFFPGPVDIAWDLAGAIVEWQMNPAAVKSFLDMYRRASGDDAQKRIEDYVTAYTVFRCAYCLMAANAMRGSEEGWRMEIAATRYGSKMSTNNLLSQIAGAHE